MLFPDAGRVRVAVRLRPRNAEEIRSDADYAECVELEPEVILNQLKFWNIVFSLDSEMYVWYLLLSLCFTYNGITSCSRKKLMKLMLFVVFDVVAKETQVEEKQLEL